MHLLYEVLVTILLEIIAYNYTNNKIILNRNIRFIGNFIYLFI